MDLKAYIRDIPDFPKKGVIFKDITPLLRDKHAFASCIHQMAEKFDETPLDYVVGIESRGFIFGAALAQYMKAGFIPVRKKGKLPSKTVGVSYQLEYGEDELEMHEDAINAGDRVVIVDDVLATGGTVEAVTNLLRRQKADIVSTLFLMEIGFLNGRDKLVGEPVDSLLKY